MPGFGETRSPTMGQLFEDARNRLVTARHDQEDFASQATEMFEGLTDAVNGFFGTRLKVRLISAKDPDLSKPDDKLIQFKLSHMRFGVLPKYVLRATAAVTRKYAGLTAEVELATPYVGTSRFGETGTYFAPIFQHEQPVNGPLPTLDMLEKLKAGLVDAVADGRLRLPGRRKNIGLALN